MSPLRATLPLLAALAALGSAPGPEPARSGIAGKVRLAAAVVDEGAAIEAPRFTGRILTDARDVRACLPLPDGAVLAGTGGGLLLVRADGSVRAPWTALDGLPETRVHALLRRGERTWIGTEGGLAAVRIHGDALTVERTFAGKPVRALAVHEGALFAATWGGGLARLDEDRGRLVRLRGGEDRWSALAAYDGTLYAASVTGLYRVARSEVTAVAGAPTSISALEAHDGRLWIGGLTGLSSMAGGAFRTESDAYVRALAASDGALLAGTFGKGALEIHGRQAVSLKGVAAPFVQALGAAEKVRCAGGPGGLLVQRGAGARWIEAPIPDLGSNDVSALARDGERLWIGTFDRGLSVLDGETVVRVKDPAVDEKINAIAVERVPGGGSVIWVATARGLDRLEPRDGGFGVSRFGELDGLPSSDVHAVAPLASGGVLVGTGRGAAIVADGHVTALGEKHGVAPGAVYAVAEGAPGTLYLGTSRGVLVGTVESREVVARGAPARPDAGAPAAPPWVQLSMATGDLDDDWVTALVVRGNRIYVGTYNAGVTLVTRSTAGAFSATPLGGGYVNLGGLLVEGGRCTRRPCAGS